MPLRQLVAIALTLALFSNFAFARRKFPPKSQRTLLSDAEIATARANVAKYPAAKKLAGALFKEADYWAAWSDEDLVKLITSADVPRAFAVSASGCPKCGDKLKEKGGDYSWIIDPKIPFKVRCPVDGSVYPDADHRDDGWGWTNPKTGEKFWFVAYWNHWMWLGKTVPGVRALGRAYVLSGDKKYAHKALVMLRRIAEVYPAMDHAKQSRYGTMMAARGIDYPGKVVNAIWETGLATSLAEAYDDVWETIDSKDDRALIEANLLEDAIDAYFAGKIRGNFGMHQSALVHLGLVRQFGDQQKWFDELLTQSSPNLSTLGLNYALYNNIYRDGTPSETAPGYNSIWIEKIGEYGELLEKTGRHVFDNPRVRRMFDGKIDSIVAREFTPSLGDSGDVWGGLVGQCPTAFQSACRRYDDPRYARYLSKIGAAGERGFTTWESLFHPPIKEEEASISTQKSRLLDGFGWGVLNNANDSIAMSLYYGLKAGHGHFDRLSIDLFANHHPMMPDLGYPDAMNDFVPGIYTWSKNTIAHNTVTVDAKRQPGNVRGTVHLFVDSPLARVIDVDGNGTYPQCSQYRRAVIMVDVDADRSYFVDIFSATGGEQHDYSLHGPPGRFEMLGGNWSRQEAGTLAGKDVALGQICDDPALGAPGYQGGYSTYAGSGFQHLFNVQRHQAGDWIAQNSHERDEQAKLRIRILDQPDQQIFSCDAHVSPARFPQIVRYLIARWTGHNLTSRFVSVIEPYKSTPLITSAHVVGSDIEIGLGSMRDVVSYEQRADGSAQVIVGRFDNQNSKIAEFSANKTTVTGKVVAVDPTKATVTVRLDRKTAPGEFAGRVVHFQNGLHRTAHPVLSARSNEDLVELQTRDDLPVGRARVDAVEPQAIVTETALPLAPIYRGTFLCADGDNSYYAVREIAGGRIELVDRLPAEHKFAVGRDAWLIDVAPGDRFEMPMSFFWSKPVPGK